MPLFSIKGYAQKGLNSDLIPSDVDSGFITNGRNIRAISGGISPFGGYTNMFNLPNGKEVHDLEFIDSGQERFWIIMCANAIYKLESTIQDVSYTGMTTIGDKNKWSCSDLSGVPIVNHPERTPMYMTQAMSKFEELPWKAGQTWKQAGKACYLMVAHKQFLFAFGCIDNGKYTPDSVRWSSVADIGGVPNTWDELDTTNVAGYTQLGGSGGAIIGAIPLRDSLVIYRTHGISVIDYIGGVYVWRIRHFNSSIGLLASQAVVEVRGTHYFLSDGDVYKTDGNSLSSIATSRVKKRFSYINKDEFNSCYAVHNPPFSEVIFFIPTSGSNHCDIAFVYNYEYDSWYSRDMPENVRCKFGMIIGKPNNWDSLTTTWDGFSSTWDHDTSTAFNNIIMCLMPQNGTEPPKLVSLSSILGTNEVVFNSIIERTDLLISNLDEATTIQQIYPHITSPNAVGIQIGSQQSPNGPVTWKPEVTFDPNTDRKVDMRTTGVLHAYRIIVRDVKSDFTISGMDILYVPAGRR